MVRPEGPATSARQSGSIRGLEKWELGLLKLEKKERFSSVIKSLVSWPYQVQKKDKEGETEFWAFRSFCPR